jgi:hypothetical protein
LAKIASAFFEPPGMAVIREYQRRMDEIFQSPWMKQQAQMGSVLRQFAGPMSAFQTLSPSALKNMSTILQGVQSSLSTLSTPTYTSALDLDPLRKAQHALKAAPSFAGAQSAIAAYLSSLSAFGNTPSGYSLAAQKEYAVAHVCTLVEDISSVVADEDEEAPLDLPAELSAEDEQIIANEVSSILSAEKNWEQRLMDSMVRLKETHPILAAVLYHLVFTILVGLLVNLISTSIGEARTPAKVYEQPRPTAPIVYHLEPLQQVKIIGAEPYYFQIELIDNETKEILTGFVSKRSLKEIEDSEDSSASN